MYNIDTAISSDILDEIMVSTDSIEYAEIARQYGANVPFMRSQKQSGDATGSWDAVLEVLEKYKILGKDFDTVCLLQPTFPLRTKEDIIAGYDLMLKKNADAITSVCEVDHSPIWTLTLDEECSLSEFRKKLTDCPRQKLETYYRLNGAIYTKRISYDERIQLLSKNEYALVMKRKNSVDIDTIDDLNLQSGIYLIMI